VKPPSFCYLAPATVAEAVEALAEPGAMVLAGGQSLVLELAYREQHPRLLVDINGIAGLATLDDATTGLTIGALVRHAAFEQPDRSPGGASPVRRLLRSIAPYVAHPPIRARGTFCGSLAWAHPAAEWNALALACDAELLLSSTTGDRVVAAADYYRGGQRTARRPDELLTAVRLPALPAGTGVGFQEQRRTHASFAEVAVVAAVTVADGRVQQVRLAVAGVGDRPLRLAAAEEALAGTPSASAAEAARRAVGPPGGSGAEREDYRWAVAAELTGRAVAAALTAEVDGA